MLGISGDVLSILGISGQRKASYLKNLQHRHFTYSLQNVINGIGGVHALFPILENASKSDEGPDLSFLSPSVEKECRLIEGHEGSVDSDEWEILPSSSYSGMFTSG